MQKNRHQELEMTFAMLFLLVYLQCLLSMQGSLLLDELTHCVARVCLGLGYGTAALTAELLSLFLACTEYSHNLTSSRPLYKHT